MQIIFTLFLLLFPSEIWQAIEISGRPIGYSVIKKYENKFSERMYFEISAMGLSKKVETYTDWEISGKNSNTLEKLSFRKITFKLKTTDQDIKITAEIIKEGGRLYLYVRSPSLSMKKPVSKNVLTGSSYIFLLEEIKGKGSLSFDYFDPSVLTLSKMNVKYIGQDKGFYIFEKEFGGVKGKIYTDFKNFREEGPMGMVVRTESKDNILRSKIQSVDIIKSSATKAEGAQLPTKDIKYLKVEIEGAENLPDSPRQKVEKEGDKLILEIFKYSKNKAKTENLTEFIKPEPFVQSDSPVIIKTAESIVGNLKGEKALRKLFMWVFTSLEKRASFGIPSAESVLKEMRGDCNEHTVLFVAMARALGFPSKILFGIVYNDGYFYYHAWADVFVDSNWIEVDPTWGQFPADPSHIRFGEGSIDKWISVLEYVGKINVSILKYE